MRRHREIRPRSSEPPISPPRPPLADFCGITVTARKLMSWETWQWLRMALKDMGYPVSGWSFGRDGCAHVEYSMRGPAKEVKRTIEELWDLERPEGEGWVDVHIQYG